MTYAGYPAKALYLKLLLTNHSTLLNLFLQAQTLLKNQIEEDSNIMKRMNDDRLVSKNNSQGE